MVDNIAILTTVANFDLYKKTFPYFPGGIRKYVIDGTEGMFALHSIKYMMRKLKGKGIDWLIMADEDVIFTRSEMVFDIIEDMAKNNISVCGVRDGGVIPHRKENPYVINTFFSIINFKELEEIWDEDAIRINNYVTENEFDDDLSNLQFAYDSNSLYEPYYCFYLWLRRKKKRFLFLESEICQDGITNTISYNSVVFLYHTWYARSYGINKKHTIRIGKILNSIGKEMIGSGIQPIVFKNKFFPIRQSIWKFLFKVKAKLRR